MKSKVIITIFFILLFTDMLVFPSKILPAKAQAVELSYDDGEADAGVSDLANKTYGFGVNFDHPELGKKYQIESARIYIYLITGTEGGLLRIFVYLYKTSIGQYEKLLEFLLGGFVQGWNTIDLTPYDVVVDQNFIIGVNWARDYIFHIGDDHDTRCHSGGFNTTDTTGFEHFVERNFMIRAYVEPLVAATVEIEPGTLNLESEQQWIEAYMEFPEGYNVSDVDVSTVKLNDTISAELQPTVVEDHDNDTFPDLMVVFNRTAVSHFILSKGIMYGNVTLAVTGQLFDETLFEGGVVIRVRMPGDINIDGKVDIRDITLAAAAFGSCSGDPRWNFIADENEDGNVDIRDLALIARNFGKNF